jgi:hypothetical protein
MKTSILISSFAALCLLLTFAEAPRRHGEVRINKVSGENISIATVERAIMLPGVTITADKKTETRSNVPDLPAEDFGYLKFDVNNFTKDASLIGGEISEMPENNNDVANPPITVSAANEFGYLRFDVNDYINKDGAEEIGELPVEEAISLNPNEITVPAESVSQFSYLKFVVSEYYNPDAEGYNDQFELPEK